MIEKLFYSASMLRQCCVNAASMLRQCCVNASMLASMLRQCLRQCVNALASMKND
jgi:hypothetical protein